MIAEIKVQQPTQSKIIIDGGFKSELIINFNFSMMSRQLNAACNSNTGYLIALYVAYHKIVLDQIEHTGCERSNDICGQTKKPQECIISCHNLFMYFHHNLFMLTSWTLTSEFKAQAIT